MTITAATFLLPALKKIAVILAKILEKKNRNKYLKDHTHDELPSPHSECSVSCSNRCLLWQHSVPPLYPRHSMGLGDGHIR